MAQPGTAEDRERSGDWGTWAQAVEEGHGRPGHGVLGIQTKKFGFYPESLERALWQQCGKMNQRLVRQEVGRGRGDTAGAGPGNVGAEP